MADAEFRPAGSIIHGAGDRYVSEKITELVMTQQELRRVVAERDALARALETIETGDLPDGSLAGPNAQQFAAEMLVRMERGELRRAG